MAATAGDGPAAELQLLLDMEQLEEEMSRMIDHEELAETCQLQLTELEMLAAMFSNPGEFKVVDPAAVAEMTDFVADKSEPQLPSRLDYIISFQTGKGKLELSVHLPLDYPNAEPDLFVRSEGLGRLQSQNINRHLAGYVQDLERGQLCVLTVVGWLQEHAEEYLAEEQGRGSEQPTDAQDPEGCRSFTRLWIYSHHIYSKVKRKDLLDLARQLDVTGFCLPGKPGLLCAEGSAASAAEWWQRVKSWNWKRILVRRKETLPVEGELSSLRLFGQFEELDLRASAASGPREHRMDMGRLYSYLDQHGCAQVFQDYFGFTGRSPDP